MNKWSNLAKPKYVSPQESKKIGLFNNEVRFVSAIYEPGKPAYIFKTFDTSVEAGDLVTVMTDTRHGMTVVQVHEVDLDIDFESDITVFWIVSKVDPEPYIALIERERQALETIRRAELRKKRDSLRADLFNDQQALLKQLDIAKSPAIEPKAD